MEIPNENMGAQPPMNDGGFDTPDMEDNTPQNTNDMSGNENPFDSNFDPGVEADEDTDPENFLKQLAGKISTSLQDFNEENANDDNGTNKYVSKMVVKQAIKGMDEEGKNELIELIKSGDDDNSDDTEDSEENTNPEENQPNDIPTNESIISFTKQQLMENIGITNEPSKRKDRNEKIAYDAPTGNSVRPFIPRNFK